jgi:ribonuclease HI
MNYADIVAAVQTLTPARRRALYRHLRAAGLLDAGNFASDQRRLRVAPALDEKRLAQLRSRPTRAPAQPSDSPGKTLTEPAKPSLVPAAPQANTVDSHGSPVSGRVVLGVPDAGANATKDPHAMSPLPGHAPERPIEIIFDGGSRGNPGFGYGSYALRWPGRAEQIVQLKFGQQVTNNEAEYDTLIAALEATLKRLYDAKADPQTARLLVRGDSLLVLNQVKGEWKCKEPRLRPRMTHVRQLLGNFKEAKLIHHKRDKSVEILGH